jgi:hypothetical protein
MVLVALVGSVNDVTVMLTTDWLIVEWIGEYGELGMGRRHRHERQVAQNIIFPEILGYNLFYFYFLKNTELNFGGTFFRLAIRDLACRIVVGSTWHPSSQR